MIRLFLVIAALLIPFISGACSTDFATIGVSAECSHAIAEAAPISEYSFLVSPDFAPRDITDLNERKLIVCGNMRINELVQLMTAPETAGTLLFRSVTHWEIDPSMDSGETRTSEDMTVVFPGGGEVTLPIEKVMRGRGDIGEPMLAACMENMAERDVLLLDKDLVATEPESLMRLVFR